MPILRLTPHVGTTSVAHGVECLERDGAVIFEQLADPSCLADLGRELDPGVAPARGGGRLVGRQSRRLGRLLTHSAAARALAVHPLVLEVAETILGRHCNRIQIGLTQAVRVEPGEPEQSLHRDDELYPVDKHGAEFMVNALWALSDLTRDGGATKLICGSHRMPATADTSHGEISLAELQAGSVLVYLGSTVHAGGGNRTNAPRLGIEFSYCLGWLRQVENQYLAYPPAVAKGFPRDLQRLIGYAVHEPSLGWYEGEDPRILLADDVSDN